MEIDDGSAKEEGERAASAARNPVASTLDVWLVRCAVLVIVALQFLVVNDLTLLPRWIMPSLELALLLPLSIATAWSIGATKKVAAADNPGDFWEIVAHHRNMIRRAFLFLTGLVSVANLLSLAGLVQAILGGHAGSGKSLLIDSLNIWTTEPLAKLPQPDEPVALLAFAERACRWIFWPDAANSAIWTTSERICGVDRLHPLCAARGGRV